MMKQLKSLPTRNKATLLTNLHKANPKKQLAYIYSITPTEQSNLQDNDLMRKIIHNMQKILIQEYGFAVLDGEGFMGSKMVEGERIVEVVFLGDSEQKVEEKVEVKIQLVKSYNLGQMLVSKSMKAMAFNIYQQQIAQRLKTQQMVQYNNQYYKSDEKYEKVLPTSGIIIMRGFHLTLLPVPPTLALQIYPCSKVVRIMNCLQELKEAASKKEDHLLVGSIVVTNYGKRRTYRVVQVDENMSPASSLTIQDQEDISFGDYFAKTYNLKVSTNEQPLLKIALRKPQKYAYLIPEFVSRTAPPTTKQITTIINNNFNQTLQETNQLLKQISQKDEFTPLLSQSFILEAPSITFKQKSYYPQDGQLSFRCKLAKPISIVDWILACSYKDQGQAQQLYDMFFKTSQAYGMTIQQPGYLSINGNSVQKWLQQLQKDCQQNGKPQIVVCYLSQHQKQYYVALKKWLTQKGIQSQIILKSSIMGVKNPMSIAANIIIQMNQKVGGVAWKVQPEGGYFKNCRFMCGGLTFGVDEEGKHSLAFVGTLTDDLAECFSLAKFNLTADQLALQSFWVDVFVDWARNFYIKRKVVPQSILVYRQTTNTPSANRQTQIQIKALQQMVKKIASKTNTNNYQPQLIYVLVDKHSKTKFTQVSTQENPSPGTAVRLESTSNQFYLSSHHSSNPTSSPSHYSISYRNPQSKMSIQQLMELTYHQAYNYVNYQGSVQRPACLQYSKKLLRMTKQLGRNSGASLGKSFYYL